MPLLCFLHLEKISIKIFREKLEIQWICDSWLFLWKTCFTSLVLKKSCRGTDPPSTLLLATISLVKIKSDPWWALVPNKGISPLQCWVVSVLRAKSLQRAGENLYFLLQPTGLCPEAHSKQTELEGHFCVNNHDLEALTELGCFGHDNFETFPCTKPAVNPV